MSYQDRVGSVERASADHKIKAAEADKRAQLMGRDRGSGDPSPTLVRRLKGLLRRR